MLKLPAFLKIEHSFEDLRDLETTVDLAPCRRGEEGKHEKERRMKQEQGSWVKLLKRVVVY